MSTHAPSQADDLMTGLVHEVTDSSPAWNLMGFPSTVDVLSTVGPATVNGAVEIQGFKHALVTCVAAAAACNNVVYLHNCPRIAETDALLKLIRRVGGTAELTDDVLTVDASTIDTATLSTVQASRIHGSIYLLPALLARFGEVVMPPAGGCQIGAGDGRRPVNQYADVLERFGASAEWSSGGGLHLKARRLHGCEIDLLDFTDDRAARTGPLYSGATKTAILAAAVAHGSSLIRAPYPKPDVTELVSLLRQVGVQIDTSHDGSYEVKGQGGPVAGLPTHHTLLPDLIEIVTWISAAALMSDSGIELRAPRLARALAGLAPEMAIFHSMGVAIDGHGDRFSIRRSTQLRPVDFTVASHGVFSDSQPFFAVLAAYASGPSTIRETVWTERFSYAEGLTALGFGVDVRPPMMTVRGNGALQEPKTPIHAHDLRSAAALLIAALTTRGEVELRGMRHLIRGYANLPQQLCELGATLTAEPTVA